MKLYDNTAKEYDLRQKNPSTNHLRKWEEKIILKHAFGKILDIGCGTGYHINLLKSAGKEAIGLDISKQMLAENKGDVLRSDATEMPFPDKSFDTVICMFSTLNLLDEKAFSEISRILKDNGVFIASFSSIWDRKCPDFAEKLMAKKIEDYMKRKTVHISKNILHLRLFEEKDLYAMKDLKLKKFYGLFIFQRPYWGRFESFSFFENLKLLFDNLQLFKKYGTMYLVVFEKRL